MNDALAQPDLRTRLGALTFIPTEQLFKIEKVELSSQELLDLVDGRSHQVLAPATSDWPSVTVAIQRGTTYLLEASSPALEVKINFSRNHEGTYEFRNRPRGPVNSGRVKKVTEVTQFENLPKLIALERFKVRFAVSTLNLQGGEPLLWMIGLNNIRAVEVEEDH